MKLGLKQTLFFLLPAIMPSSLFASWGGAADDDIAILGLAFLFLSGIGVAYLIRYAKESIIPAMQVMMNPPLVVRRRVYDEDETGLAVSHDFHELHEANSGMEPEH